MAGQWDQADQAVLLRLSGRLLADLRSVRRSGRWVLELQRLGRLSGPVGPAGPVGPGSDTPGGPVGPVGPSVGICGTLTGPVGPLGPGWMLNRRRLASPNVRGSKNQYSLVGSTVRISSIVRGSTAVNHSPATLSPDVDAIHYHRHTENRGRVGGIAHPHHIRRNLELTNAGRNGHPLAAIHAVDKLSAGWKVSDHVHSRDDGRSPEKLVILQERQVRVWI